MRQRPRNGRGYDLIGLGPDGNRRRHTDKDQQRRHEEAAADAEHTRQKAYHTAKPEEHQGIERHFSNGQVNLHFSELNKCLAAVPFCADQSIRASIVAEFRSDRPAGQNEIRQKSGRRFH